MGVISVKLLIYVVNSLVMGFGILPILSSVLVCWKQKKNAKASRPFHSKQRTTHNGLFHMCIYTSLLPKIFSASVNRISSWREPSFTRKSNLNVNISLNLLDNILFNLNNCFPSDRLVTGVSGSRCSLRDCHAMEDWWQFCFWIDDVILSWIQIFPWCCGIVTEGHENCSN